MKRALFFITALIYSIGAFSQVPACDQIIGNWITPKKDLIVSCYKVNGMYYGKIVWFKNYYDNEHGKDVAVPEDQWLNYVVMKHFSYVGNQWKNGEIYDLNSGKKYDSYIVLKDANTLKVTGFLWLTIFSQSMYFNRYTDEKLPPFN